MTELIPFDYQDGDTALHGLIARPKGPGPHPAVIVVHDALGIGEMLRRRTRDLAEAGYVALLADMYGLGPGEAEFEKATAGYVWLHEKPERLRGRMAATCAALGALPEVDAGRMGAIGYCFGGSCVLELARSGANVRSVVSFHGELLTKAPAQPGAVKAKVLAITGLLDPYAPKAHVEAFEQEMVAAGADWQMTVYGTGYHAFTDPDITKRVQLDGLKYDPLLDRVSWAQALAMLDATVRDA
jgi:dienelactone hydrolase